MITVLIIVLSIIVIVCCVLAWPAFRAAHDADERLRAGLLTGNVDDEGSRK